MLCLYFNFEFNADIGHCHWHQMIFLCYYLPNVIFYFCSSPSQSFYTFQHILQNPPLQNPHIFATFTHGCACLFVSCIFSSPCLSLHVIFSSSLLLSCIPAVFFHCWSAFFHFPVPFSFHHLFYSLYASLLRSGFSLLFLLLLLLLLFCLFHGFLRPSALFPSFSLGLLNLPVITFSEYFAYINCNYE